MRFFLISDNTDTQTGMRLAGIEGVVAHTAEEVTNAFELALAQPGRPGPQGLSHEGSPGLAPFQRAKSMGLCLRSSTSIRAPAIMSSRLRPLNLP